MNLKPYGINFGIYLSDIYTLKAIVDNYPDKEHLKMIYNILKDPSITLTKKQKEVYRRQIADNVRETQEDKKTIGLLSANLTRFTDHQILKWITCYIDENPDKLSENL